MKRSRSIRLVLIGGVSAIAWTSCAPSGSTQTLGGSEAVYTNNHYVPGVGHYHAPFRGWYSLPYNHFDPNTQRYFQGGQWAATPHESITNLSSPTAEMVRQVRAQTQATTQRTGVTRSGFGSTGRSHSFFS